MDFELDDDQLELQQVVRDVVGRECPPSVVRDVVAGGYDGTGLWKTYVGLDWPTLTIPEDAGGMGFGAVELVIVVEQLGWVADPTPFLGTTTQYLPLVREVATGAARTERLEALVAGGTGAAVDAVDTVTARAEGGGWVLSGSATWVLDADRADQLAVVAATPEGPGLFLLPASDAATERQTAFDGALHLARVAFADVAVPADRSFVVAEAASGIERARHEALAGMSAATVGACQRILDLALEHVKSRHQFGVPIGSFQAVKHMAVDVYVAIERARALAQYAGLTIAEDDERRAVAASMAKAAAGDAQRIAVKHGIQLFGGLGFTWENDLQIYVRRAKAGELLLGGSAHHRAQVAAALMGKDER